MNNDERGRTFRYSHQEMMPPVLGPGVDYLETDATKPSQDKEQPPKEEVKELPPE